eukprot:5746609-Prymnesium_polylepis.1
MVASRPRRPPSLTSRKLVATASSRCGWLLELGGLVGSRKPVGTSATVARLRSSRQCGFCFQIECLTTNDKHPAHRHLTRGVSPQFGPRIVFKRSG